MLQPTNYEIDLALSLGFTKSSLASLANAKSPVPLPYKTSRVCHNDSYAKFGTNAMLMHCKKPRRFQAGVELDFQR